MRRDLELNEDPYKTQQELEEIDNEVQDLQLREYDPEFTIKRSTTFFSLKEPKALFREVKRALQKRDQ